MKLIDSHCHIIDERFENVGLVIDESRVAGVESMIMPTGNLKEAIRAIEVAKKYNLFAMVGIHPESVEEVGNLEEMIKEERSLCEYNRDVVVGIGEIGLDFYFDKEKVTRQRQEEIFQKQLDLALELRLPVVIHMREAEEEMLAILEKMETLPPGQFHCFAGSEHFLTYVIKRGFYVSFAGNITYKSASNLRELVKKVPLTRLLLETDSPYLAPEPVRGSVNNPANVKIIAAFIANHLGLEPEKLAEITTNNTKCLYSLDI